MVIKNKTYFSLAIFATLTVLMIVFAIFPLMKDIRKNSLEFVSQKQNLADLEEKVKNLDEFKVLYKEYGQNIDMVNDLFIDSEVPVAFITFLEDIAKDCQLEIKISPGSSKYKDETGYYLIFGTGISGLSGNIIKFIDKIENAPYLIKINSMNLNKGENGAGSSNISFNVYAK